MTNCSVSIDNFEQLNIGWVYIFHVLFQILPAFWCANLNERPPHIRFFRRYTNVTWTKMGKDILQKQTYLSIWVN